MNVSAQVFAGLGLFFVGVRLVGSHVRQLAAGRVRQLLSHALTRPGIGPLAGLLAGAVTQSASAVTFIMSGLITAGTLDLRRGLTMLAWANVGTSLLVLVATIELHTALLFAFGWLGIAFLAGLDQSDRYRHGVLALFGLAVLMFGLTLMKESVSLLRDDSWMREFIVFAGSAPLIEFLFGIALAMVTQSASVVAVLTLPLLQDGALQLPDSVMMIYGAGLGSGVSVLLVSTRLEGSARQLALCQTSLRTMTALVLAILLWAEQAFDVPLLRTAIASTAAPDAVQCSVHFLIFQTVGAAFALLLPQPFIALAQRLSPPSPVESSFKPRYLFDDAAQDAETACELSRLESIRLIARLPAALNELRPAEEQLELPFPRAERHQANRAIAEAIVQLLASTIRKCPDSDADPIFAARSLALALIELQQALEDFVQPLVSVDRAHWPDFVHGLVEGLHAILSELAQAWQQGDRELWDFVMKLTEDRGELMERLRKELLAGSLAISGREALLSGMLAFERVLWTIRRLPAPA